MPVSHSCRPKVNGGGVVLRTEQFAEKDTIGTIGEPGSAMGDVADRTD